jgi:hypothetical protein
LTCMFYAPVTGMNEPLDQPEAITGRIIDIIDQPFQMMYQNLNAYVSSIHEKSQT